MPLHPQALSQGPVGQSPVPTGLFPGTPSIPEGPEILREMFTTAMQQVPDQRSGILGALIGFGTEKAAEKFKLGKQPPREQSAAIGQAGAMGPVDQVAQQRLDPNTARAIQAGLPPGAAPSSTPTTPGPLPGSPLGAAPPQLSGQLPGLAALLAARQGQGGPGQIGPGGPPGPPNPLQQALAAARGFSPGIAAG